MYGCGSRPEQKSNAERADWIGKSSYSIFALEKEYFCEAEDGLLSHARYCSEIELSKPAWRKSGQGSDEQGKGIFILY